MFAVLTIDQRKSREAAENRADEWAADLNASFEDELLRPFATTLGDEIQGVTGTPRTIVEILLRGAKENAWWLGVGIGDVELQQTAARSRGPAFYNATVTVARPSLDDVYLSHTGRAFRPEAMEIAR